MANQDRKNSGRHCLRVSLSLIGVFDSGVGGLSILDEALRQFPEHDYIYLADSANAPYGEKSSKWISERSLELCQYLASKGCDAIVVACNTATAEAIKQIRLMLGDLPIVGVEPGIKPASMQTQNGIVGVLATDATLNSDKFNSLLATLPTNCRFIKQTGVGLVSLIESGKANAPETIELLSKYLEPIQKSGADTLVLGCTHYPFLAHSIRKILGHEIKLIDTSEAVIRQLGKRLPQTATVQKENRLGMLTLVSSSNGTTLLKMTRDLITSDLKMYSICEHTIGTTDLKI